MKLVIISHTEHYLTADGTLVGLGSTVTEINHLLEVFDHITHVAMLHGTPAPANALPYVSNRIRFVALPAVGGHTLNAKIAVVRAIPKIIGLIKDSLKTADYFQFRAPTGIGVFVIPYLILFRDKRGWFKYAGNWKQEDAPLAYRFQKWCLEHQSRKVTINGFWEDQPKQCLSFENPCLTAAEVAEGRNNIQNKKFQIPINLCFVGRLEAAKGIDLIIDAIASLEPVDQKKIGTIHLVGDGAHISDYKNSVASIGVHFKFHGYLSRTEVHSIYKDCHALLLPSASEGFPKVIAEAMNYGCVPIVSDISSIGQYLIENSNGFLLKQLTSIELQHSIVKFLNLSEPSFISMVSKNTDFVKSFTYTHYNKRLKDAIL